MLMPPRGHRVLLSTDAVGGVWRYSMELAAGLRALGTDVLVVSLGPQPSEAQAAEAWALRVTDLPLDWLARSAGEVNDAARELADIAAEWGADSVHLHSPALAPGGGWRMPVVAVAHSCVATWWRAVRGEVPMPADLRWRAALTGRGLQRADVALAPSRAFARALAETYGCAVQAIHNGRRQLHTPAGPRRGAMTAGRLWDEGKNLSALDDAAGRLDIEVSAAGPCTGPNGATISCRNLRLLGPLDDESLARRYARAAVFVSVARYEPFGLAVLEAAQAGCALVLSDIPTFRELWDGAASFVDPGDPREIAHAMEAAMRDPRRGTAARARAAGYSAEAMAKATLDVHRALLRAGVS